MGIFHTVFKETIELKISNAWLNRSMQGVLRSIWSGRLECFFVDPKGAKISKNGNNIICTL